MKFIAEIDVMPLDELLDPQGKVVTSGLNKLGLDSVGHVRIGKHITMELEAESEEKAQKLVENSCQKLLANPVIEKFTYRLESKK